MSFINFVHSFEHPFTFMSKPVYINRISKFLPGAPIGNDEMEEYLGYVGGQKSKAKSLILRHNKIASRYYSRDKKGNTTYTNAEMTAEAIKNLCVNGFSISDIQLLTSGTTSPDQLLPGHALMVQGLLMEKAFEAISFSGSCCASMNALKYAWMSIMTGNSTNAVTTGSEKLSSWMIAQNFNEEINKLKELEENPVLSFEKDFLRWMLSDGASAVLLSDKPNTGGISLRIDGIDIISYANEVETCMYAGAEKDEQGNLQGWSEFSPKDRLEKSLFSIRQDTRLLEKNITRLGAQSYLELLRKHNLDPQRVDWLLPHISSEYFRSKVDLEMKLNGVQLPPEKWFVNLSSVGNVGAASIFLALEELMNSGKLKKDQKIVLAVPESARFSYAHVLLTVC